MTLLCFVFQLYTAFFKSKVELYLRDIDVILSILEALGYRKTGEDLELVSLREPNAEGAKRVSFQLFLVQLELQIIKEIMEEFTEVCTESKCTLEDVITVSYTHLTLPTKLEV